jgi:NADPH-dependent glutamate synthase beta subunit-like oxidoreductase/Pyruvate/2-oxoacid:ferredoxin oxidoreductase delta subunit
MNPDNKSRSLTVAGEEIPVEKVSASPCAVACPAGVSVKSYVTLIAAGRFREALEVVRARNPFPGICGRVCTHPCESSCNRADMDKPVAIRDLKRFIADWEVSHPAEAKATPPPRRFKEKVAVVGSGPAGLTAANDLARMGYGVTIFESLPKAGGMMVAGIPAFRLPRAVIEAEIHAIADLGVEIRTNTPVGPNLTIEDLLERHGYSAVFLAIGAHKGKKLGIPGEDAGLDAVEFLRHANLGRAEKPGDSVLVVGGGNSAIDAARTALRLGTGKVRIVYRRTRDEMPADKGEIEEAEEEGIPIDLLVSPVKVVLKDGRTAGLEVIRNRLGEPDKSGRRSPVPIPDSEFVIPCDRVIAAISQEPDLSFLAKDHGIATTKWSTFAADKTTLQTNVPAVFAGGDAYTGPASVIDAIRDGHKASVGIHAFLRGEPIPVSTPGPERPGDLQVPRVKEEMETAERIHVHHRDPEHRMRCFEEVVDGYTEEEAKGEAGRCLHCGPCTECMLCVTACDRKLFVAEDEEGRETFVRIPLDSAAYKTAHAHLEAMLKGPAEGDGREVKLEPVTSYVLEELCRGCGECGKVCEYGAAELVEKNGRLVTVIDEALCRGCGTCAAICPSGAIVARHFTDDWVEDRLKNALFGAV